MNETARAPRKTSFVGLRIRELRKQRGLTQSDLANRITVLQSDLCRMEKGEYKDSLDVLFRILQVFGMNVADFFEERVAAPAAEEKELLEAFRTMPVETRQQVLDFVRFKMSQEKVAGNE